jgi:hypothetical protein
VRSLNVSGNKDKMVLKVRALVKNKHEIIFLSDTRLNSTKQIAAMNDFKKTFFAEGCDFYHQSTLSSRGVGILISRKLQYKINTINGDNLNCNYLLLKLEIGDSHLIVGAIYGPNTDNEINFFENLSDSIRSLNTNSIILGGDWNATWDYRLPGGRGFAARPFFRSSGHSSESATAAATW